MEQHLLWRPIPKDHLAYPVQPNLEDYDATRAAFHWDTILREIGGSPDDPYLNIAQVAVDRHVEQGRGGQAALRWIGKAGSMREFSYAELQILSNRFANVLGQFGLTKGERVFILTGRIPELYIAALGTWKHTAVFCPLFSAFGPEPIWQRMSRGQARILVTTERLYRRKVSKIRDRLPDLEAVILVDGDAQPDKNIYNWQSLMASADDSYTIPPTNAEDMAILHFTSGTTGMPKGAVHVHKAVMTHYMTGKYVLDMHPGDVYWCTADPGWVTGISYGVIAPLAHGVLNIIDEAEFDAERWCNILEEHRVNIWYTAPTAIRRLMRLGIKPAREYDLQHLRLVHSVGEPLNPEGVIWGVEALNLPIHDNWWQTETGGIMISNYATMDVRPGSMGKPVPGVEAAIVRRIGEQAVEVIDEPNVEGDLALRPGWPSMFRTYLNEEERYNKCFKSGWYITGDLARRDADGYFWFIGRADDIIKTSGHMVGPFEVESALIEHPAVAEVGVIGIPDQVAGEIVKAFVTLNPGYDESEDLRLDLIGFARKRLGVAVAPKEIEFKENLPKTRSGKIMRRLLKARELGLPEGDTSTLEND